MTATERGSRKHVTGTVVSDRMRKTIVVESHWLAKHPRYQKYVRKRTRFFAHDEKNEAHIGDIVEIAETRPLSRKKRWRLVRVVTRTTRAPEPAEAQAQP